MTAVNQLRAGVSRSSLNVPLGIYQIGYGDRSLGCRGVHDPLTATALCLDDGATQLLIIALDMLALNEQIVQRVRQRIAAQLSVPAEQVMICCSHTHSAPIAYADKHSKRKNRRFIDGLIETLAETASAAMDNAAPAVMEWGHGEAYIAVNRRQRQPDGSVIIGVNPDGAVDRSLNLLRFQFIEESTSQPKRQPIIVINFACHPTTLGPSNRLISADWPGVMRQEIEATFGGTALFMQGATGDLNPNHEWGDHDMVAVERLGREVAAQATAILNKGLTPVKAVPLKATRSAVPLPLVPQKKADGSHIKYKEVLAKMVKLPSLLVDPILNARYPWKTTLLRQEESWFADMAVQLFRIGDCALMAQAAETFNEIGSEIKQRSPAPITLVAGYSNGCIGYLPTTEAHHLGGYEVEIVPYLYRMPGLLDAGCQTLVTDHCLQMLNTLFPVPLP